MAESTTGAESLSSSQTITTTTQEEPQVGPP